MTQNEQAVIAEWRQKLRTDQRWALRALQVIHGFQTAHEQTAKVTDEDNGVGFNKLDAEILTDFYQKFFQRGWKPSPRQMRVLHRRMPKYARQLYEHARKEPRAVEARAQAAEPKPVLPQPQQRQFEPADATDWS